MREKCKGVFLNKKLFGNRREWLLGIVSVSWMIIGLTGQGPVFLEVF